MKRETLEAYGLAAIGLVRGIGEVILAPLVASVISKLPLPDQEEIDQHIMASVQYYNTGEDHGVAGTD